MHISGSPGVIRARVAMLLLCVLASCAPPTRGLKQLPRELSGPLEALPEDAAFYVKMDTAVAASLVPVLFSRDGAPRETGPAELPPAFVPALQLLTRALSDAPASTGVDAARPAYVSVGTSDASALVQALALAQPLSRTDLPRAARLVLLLPAKDASTLSRTLRNLWAQLASNGRLPTSMFEATTLGPWVRAEIFSPVTRQWTDPGEVLGGRPTDAGRTEAGQQTTPHRLTPALAAFARTRSGLSLYVPLEGLRRFAAASQAHRLLAAAEAKPAAERARYLQTGALELAGFWQVTEPRNAELEDVTLHVEKRPSKALRLLGTATWTKAGRRIAEAFGKGVSVPQAEDAAGALIDLQLSGTLHELFGPANLPPILASLPAEKSREVLSGMTDGTGPFALLPYVRAPFSFLRFAPAATQAQTAASHRAQGMRVWVPESALAEAFIGKGHGFMLAQFESAESASKALQEMRGRERAHAPRALDVLEENGADTPTLVGAYGTEELPRFRMNERVHLKPGLSLVLSRELTAFSRLILRRWAVNSAAAADLIDILTSGPARFELTPTEQTLQLRLEAGGAEELPPLVAPEIHYEPWAPPNVAEADCRMWLASIGMRALKAAAARGEPPSASQFDTLRTQLHGFSCVKRFPALEGDVHTVRSGLDRLQQEASGR